MTSAPSEQEIFLMEAYVADNPGSGMFTKLARAYEENGRLADAAQVLKRGLANQPANLEARGLLASVLTRMGDRAGALDQAEAGASELARHAGIFGQLADLYAESGNSEKAAAVRALSLRLAQGLSAPPDDEAQETEAQIQAARGHLAQAAGVYEDMMASPGGDVLLRLESLRQAALKRAAGRA